ncbi:capsular biosynthesis protein [Alteromonas mediterranea]|uniref:capsular biosynthesis protein n=1 Tax=Alteromonas mediterranea TaxID=314275 RepID=UPI00112FE345|nr:capsular biosynthesis protein [Alteromonas mediterranea]QDG36255.1 capsular biosynthesis protein [Alteromonas mediterranea]
MKKLVLDIDGTITIDSDKPYSEKPVNEQFVKQMNEYKRMGFEIILFTSRNMRTYDGNIGKINKNTLPTLMTWLEKNEVPYDEIYVGKPWCGFDGFYVDDKAIRPSEFTSLSYEEIQSLLNKENPFKDGGNK